jgi:hypothetical protein
VRGKELIVALVGASISPVVREYDDRPRSHLLAATRTSFTLKEGCRGLRRFVLENGANVWVIEADLERGSCHYDFGAGVDSCILGTRAADANARARCKHVPNFLDEGPVLPSFKALAGIGKRRGAKICERAPSAPRIWATEGIPAFRVEKAVVKAIDDVQVVGESEDATAVRASRTTHRQHTT